jgi:Tfp pilus assembly protein FimT
MHLARSEAVTRNARVAVCASDDGERCGDEPWERGWIA